MQKHTAIYMKFFGYDVSDFIPCEIPECQKKGVDIHHIESRKNGGDHKGKKDVISNLMCLCRECHIKYGDKKHYKEYLQQVHNNKMNAGNS